MAQIPQPLRVSSRGIALESPPLTLEEALIATWSARANEKRKVIIPAAAKRTRRKRGEGRSWLASPVLHTTLVVISILLALGAIAFWLLPH